MEPHEYVATLRRRWLMIVVMAIIGAGLAYAYASTLPPLYRSSSSVFVGSQRGETTSELVQANTFTQAQVQSYAQFAQLPIVLDRVVDELGLAQSSAQLAGSVSADIRLNTTIIDVSVTDPSPQVAATIADAVTRSLASVAEDTAPRSDQNEPAITITTVSSARVPTAPFSPNTRLIIITGAGVGLALGVLYALAREMLDTRVRSEKDLARVSGAPVLGTVMRRKRKTASPIVMRSGPYTPGAEAFRRIATNLEFIDVDIPVRSVVVTSALPGEGKSSTSINLALAIAERLERVLIIDGDLRKPSIAEYCQIDGSVGLTSVLVGSASLEDAVRPWADGLVDVLPAGTIPANPSQMLGSDAMSRLVEDLVSRYDFVVIDAPPLLPVTDPLTLAKLTDGALVITRFKVVRRQQLAQSLQSLEAVSARLLGLVVNGVNPERGQAYYGRRPEDQPVDAAADETAAEKVVEPAADGSAPVAAGPVKAGSDGSAPIIPAPVSGPAVAGPAVAGPAVSGPAVAGPGVAGPAVSGPANAGPAVSAGPVVSGPAVPVPWADTDVERSAEGVNPFASAPQAVAHSRDDLRGDDVRVDDVRVGDSRAGEVHAEYRPVSEDADDGRPAAERGSGAPTVTSRDDTGVSDGEWRAERTFSSVVFDEGPFEDPSPRAPSSHKVPPRSAEGLIGAIDPADDDDEDARATPTIVPFLPVPSRRRREG